MKTLAAALFLFVCAHASAQAPQNNQNFEEAKQHRLSNIDQRINYLNELKSCVQGATNKDGMKACQAKHKQELDTLKAGNQSWKQGRKANRQSKKNK